jgi:GNAT superfamily N-acetyltransferase
MTKESLEDVWCLIQSTTIRVSKRELENYVLSFFDDYSYKFAAVATFRQKVVGFALFSDCDEEIFLNHLFVVPIQRFEGIGTKLMDKVKEFAGKRSVSFHDVSNNYMPWMDCLEPLKRADFVNARGSFYSR